ncbi:carbohydrate ABC transporter permease [Allostreptomyces psammosilenae]|uniref:Multiple sugar transport system permease protein n=1 Tax=Allostreptomyces psammosilenae TaxID=1892865 RepID=A0A852ZRN9_9ACTN|nr:sugar ABC transporter permease [Allostreptomyces psammosilenae]NYI03524.1 multiple sugar transport system permease protein [Allostreptomyces psammosilenae]
MAVLRTAEPGAPRPSRAAGAASGGSPTPARNRAGRRSGSLTGWMFVLPFLVVYALFLVWPTVSGLWMSFFNVSLSGSAGEFVALDNWIELFGDPAVWSSLWHTVQFTIISTPLLVGVGLGMALLTNRAMPARWLWRLAFFGPFVLPVTTVTLIFVWLFQPGFGLADTILGWFGIEGIGWLSDPRFAMWSIVLATLWWTVGFNYLLYLAALQSIPEHLYEAAAIDGASRWRQLWSITIPMLNRTTGLIVVLQLLASLKVFDQIYLMTSGGPNYATRPIIQYIYDAGFTNYRIGYASAISYFFFALIILVSVAQFRFTSRQEGKK